MTSSRRVPRALLGLLAAVLAIGALGAPAQVPLVRGALPDLTLVTTATYNVEPNAKRVLVTVNITASNRLQDTPTRRYYFDRAFLAVPRAGSDFELTSETGSPSVESTARRDDYQILALSFGQRIRSQRSANFQLTFVLRDNGGEATRNVRVGTALAAFPVWAYASESTPGSRVRVVFPRGFNVQVVSGELPEPKVDGKGRISFDTGELEDPLSFFAYVVADRPTEYAETSITAPVGDEEANVTVRSWPDDPEWAERVGGLVERGLPVLHELIGLPWEREEPVVIQESVSRTTGGYAGLFDPAEGRIEVAYYADASVVLHEAAHLWFNGSLLRDRWANEAFASWYAAGAAERLGEAPAPTELTEALQAAAFPLNAWGAAGEQDATAEDYGYAASMELARQIAERAGHRALMRVWAAAAERQAGYQPPRVDPAAAAPAPETAADAPDWRGLLDLLEDETGKRYDDLWRQWVVRDDEAPLLDARADARERYGEVLAAAGRWELPRSVRDALRAWDFDTATSLLDDATALLERRDELESAAAAAGLRLPTRLETAFESDAGFEAAEAEADAQAAAIEILSGAADARPTAPDPLQTLGLVGEAPDAAIASAREAFAAGDLEGAAREAVRAQGIWQGAWEIGRNRLLVGIGVALLVLLAFAFAASLWLGRRRRHRDEALAAAAPAGLAADGARDGGEAAGPSDVPERREREAPPA